MQPAKCPRKGEWRGKCLSKGIPKGAGWNGPVSRKGGRQFSYEGEKRGLRGGGEGKGGGEKKSFLAPVKEQNLARRVPGRGGSQGAWRVGKFSKGKKKHARKKGNRGAGRGTSARRKAKGVIDGKGGGGREKILI